MSTKKFTWSNGTESSPITLNTTQVNTLIAAGKSEDIEASVSGVIKTQTGIYKYLKYSLGQLFPNLTVLGETVADEFAISVSTSNLFEGNSLNINISSSVGMTAADLQYKVIFGTVTTDNVLSEDVIKSRITCANGVLSIAAASENGTWSVPVTVRACPLYEDIETTSNYVETTSILCRAIAITGFTANADSSSISTNSSTPITYSTTPSNTTKLSSARIEGDITVGDGTYSDGIFYAGETTGDVVVRIKCYLFDSETAYFTTTVNVTVKNSTQSTISIWNGGISGSISDTRSMVTGDTVANADTAAIVAMPDNVIYQIRQNSHLYVGKYYGRTTGMKLKQLDDNDRTKYSDGTTAVIDGTPDSNGIIGDVFLKLPTFYYKCVTNENDANKVDIIFSTGNDEENSYTEWNTNTLIGVYKGTILDASNTPVGELTATRSYTSGDTLHSISGAVPTVYYSQDSFKKAARARNTTVAGQVPTDGFSIITYEAHVVMAILYYAFYGAYNINCQSVIGAGTSTYPKTTGATDAYGMNDTYSSSLSGTGDSQSINFWGLENWWGDISEWMDNLITANSTGLINILNWQGNVVRTVQSNVTLSTGQCISKMVWNTQGGYVDMIPDELSGSGDYTKYYADYGCVYASSGYVALRSDGGSGAYGGVGCLILHSNASITYGIFGSRLVFSGTVTDVTGTEEADNF